MHPAAAYPGTPSGLLPMPPGLLPTSPVKPKGRKRKAFGGVLAALSVLPMLLAGAVLVQAYRNHQIPVPNPEFPAVAWHNLRTDQVFPEHIGISSPHRQQPRAWSRQVIAEEASCQEVLSKDFAKVATANDCRTVLRATYVHIGGTVVATIGLVVLGSGGDGMAVANEDFDTTSAPGPLVLPLAAPGTAAARWVKEHALAGNAVSSHKQYVVACSVGPTDASRAVARLPDEWKWNAESELEVYEAISADLVQEFNMNFHVRML